MPFCANAIHLPAPYANPTQVVLLPPVACVFQVEGTTVESPSVVSVATYAFALPVARAIIVSPFGPPISTCFQVVLAGNVE